MFAKIAKSIKLFIVGIYNFNYDHYKKIYILINHWPNNVI